MSPFRFYIGTHAPAGQPSILHCSADFRKETFTTISTLQEISDPTYLSSSDGMILYTLGKASDGDRVFALRGQAILDSLPSGGRGPCHVCVDEHREFLLCANYVSGSVSLYDLNRDGSIHSLCDFRQYSGVGFDSGDRQKGPHAHFAAFHAERDEVLVCDLGLDMVYVYELDRAARRLRDTRRSIRLPDGSGPRHLAFSPAHPGMLFVLTEMANMIFTYRFDPDSCRYVRKQQISAVCDEGSCNEGSCDGGAGVCPPDEALMVPPTADNGSIGCAIRFTQDGAYLFVSSRLGYQCISAFSCSPEGRLRFCSRCLCGGITPRDLNVFEDNGPGTEGPMEDARGDGRSSDGPLSDRQPSDGLLSGGHSAESCVHLLVANQDSDLVTALRFDRRTEKLSLLHMKMQAVKPTCILPV